MSQLVHEDGLRTSALATFASMTAQSMGELVDDLERLGYVERRPDPADRRAKLVYLTARGQAAVAASGHAVRAQEAELSRRLGTDGRKRLRDQLLSLLEDSPG
jgi:DNA-binding MarR family transcriptional regulator